MNREGRGQLDARPSYLARREIRPLASRERGADRIRIRVHRLRERRARVLDHARVAQGDAAEVAEECAVRRPQRARMPVGIAELRADRVAILWCGYGQKRLVHRDALARSRELRITSEIEDELRAALAIAPDRDEIAPRERETHVDLFGQERSGTSRVAGAVQRGVRRDEPDDDGAVLGKLLRDLLEEHRRRERIARGIEDLSGYLPYER